MCELWLCADEHYEIFNRPYRIDQEMLRLHSVDCCP